MGFSLQCSVSTEANRIKASKDTNDQGYKVCSECRNHNLVLSSFMTCHLICNKSNMTGATCGAGNANPSGAPEFVVVFILIDLQFSV